jgi:hypothetical protein
MSHFTHVQLETNGDENTAVYLIGAVLILALSFTYCSYKSTVDPCVTDPRNPTFNKNI